MKYCYNERTGFFFLPSYVAVRALARLCVSTIAFILPPRIKIRTYRKFEEREAEQSLNIAKARIPSDAAHFEILQT